MPRRGKKKTSKKYSTAGATAQPKIVDADAIDDSEDEEIPEEEAFNSEDERLYGHFFQEKEQDKSKSKKNKALTSLDDEDVTSGSENEDDDSSTNSGADEDEDDDDDDGQYMLDLLNKLDAVNEQTDDKKASLAHMGKIAESDYSNSLSKTGVTLDNLMEGIQDTQGFRDLQKAFAKQRKATPAPLDSVVANRVERKLAYEARSKDISRWVKAVQENRQAETLDFKPKERMDLTRDSLIEKFEPKTDFEKEIEQALEEAGQQDEEAVLKAEEEALQDDLGANKLTIEEYKKRRGQLAQIRALMFYHEQKRHHMKKIKSKTYRRIRKKQRERLKDSAMEAAIEQDEDLAQELKEKDQLARIQERMTLAHKNTSKWAKRILKRGKNVDVDTRRALSAQIKRGDDLRRKMMGDQPSDNDDCGSSDEDVVEAARNVLQDAETAFDPTHGKTGLFKLSFMQKGIQKQRDQAKEEARKLLSELEANEMDDYDEIGPNYDAEEKDIRESAPTVASAKDLKNVIQKGDLVVASLEFGRSNSISTSGGIEIDLEEQNENNFYRDGNGLTLESNEGTGFVSKVKSNQQSESPVAASDGGQLSESLHQTKMSNTDVSALQPKLKSVEEAEDMVNPWIQRVDSENVNHHPIEISAAAAAAKRAKRTGVVDIAGAADILDATTTRKETMIGSGKKSQDATNEVGEKMITALTQEELVRRAFVGQSQKEIDEEFRKEKEAIAAESDSKRKMQNGKATDDVAGWGSWAGQGTAPPKPRRLPKKLQPPKKKPEAKRKRLDDGKPCVIINQKRLKKTANAFMLGDAPHPYATREEYEQAMLGGIGKEWNVSTCFKKMTRPEILTRSGKIIQPISKKAKQPRPAAKF